MKKKTIYIAAGAGLLLLYFIKSKKSAPAALPPDRPQGLPEQGHTLQPIRNPFANWNQ